MTQAELLRYLVDVLETLGVRDTRYITEWADRLGVRALWDSVLKRVETDT